MEIKSHKLWTFLFKTNPAALGIAQASLALRSELRRVESCRKYRQDKGFDRLRMGEIVKAFVIMPPPRDVQVYALLWLGHPQVH